MQDRVEALHRRVGDSVSWLDSDRGVTNVLPAACIPSPPALLLVTYPEYTAPHRWLIHCVSTLRPLSCHGTSCIQAPLHRHVQNGRSSGNHRVCPCSIPKRTCIVDSEPIHMEGTVEASPSLTRSSHGALPEDVFKLRSMVTHHFSAEITTMLRTKAM